MATLFSYLQACQRILREQKQEFENPGDLIHYINTARKEVALHCQCIRVLTPISAQILSATVTNGGTGYVNPVVAITSPDFPSGYGPFPNGKQATAIATQQNGIINSVDIQDGGSGYFQPSYTITDGPAGAGATLQLTVGPMNLLNLGQEVYLFKDIDLSGNPGCSSVYYVRSVAIIYANYRYVIPIYSFTEYQAHIRQYPFQYQYVPTFGSFFGQGAAGSLYVYPLPSQTYQMEFDCLVLPSDLTDNLSVDAIPEPWTGAVKFYVGYLVMLERGNFNAAKMYHEMFMMSALNYSNNTRVGRMINPYGRV